MMHYLLLALDLYNTAIDDVAYNDFNLCISDIQLIKTKFLFFIIYAPTVLHITASLYWCVSFPVPELNVHVVLFL